MESSIFPIDQHFKEQFSALLKSPSPQQVQEYFDHLVKSKQHCGIRVKQDGKFGKGVCAVADFGEEELILKDQMLVGAQCFSNKTQCLDCSFCFRFVESVELQIARKLYFQELGEAEDSGSDQKT